MLRKNIIIPLCFLYLLFLPGMSCLKAQLLRDTVSFSLVKEGVSCIYDMKFREADDICGKINELYPGHPIGFLMKGMLVYWENYPLTVNSPVRFSFEKELRTCIDKCKTYDPADEAEFLLTSLSARGLLLTFYADNKMSSDIAPLVTSTYRYIRRSFNFTGSYYDFCFFTGLYNYYREAYPEAHPLYKPLALLFPKGNREKGLEELQSASMYSVILKTEAASFLSYIYLFHENNYSHSSDISKNLCRSYPSNIYFRSLHIRNLLLNKRYDEAENLILVSDMEISNLYFQAQLTIFKGILQEKKYRNRKDAWKKYLHGIDQISDFGNYGNDVVAYAYFGLSRISGINNDPDNQKLYRKKALALTDFDTINFDN